MTALTDAITALIEANAALRKRRALARPERTLERAMAKAFTAEGRAVLSSLARLKSRFPPAVQEAVKADDLITLFDKAVAESTHLFADPIDAAATTALESGMAAAATDLSLDISFDLKHPRAVAYLKDHGAGQVKRIRQTTRETLQLILAQAADEGWSYDRTAKAITDRYKHFSTERAKRIAVFECLPGDTLVRPFALPPGALPGKRLSLPFGRLHLQSLVDTPSGHVVGDGAHPTVLGATRRWYVGPLVHITTAGGHQLSATPNHPVLTDRGWIGLGLLKEGDHVVCSGEVQGMTLGNPDIEDVPTPIGQVFDALRRAEGVLLQRVAGGDRDFHGDGMDSEIEVVWANRDLSLEFKAAHAEQIDHDLFAAPDLALGDLSALRSSGNGPRALLAALPHAGEFAHATGGGRVGILEEIPSLLRTSVRPFEPDVFGGLPNHHPSPLQSVADGISGDADRDGDGAHGLSGSVAFDHVVNVQVRAFAGHVYNLITSHGSYAGNTILLHNCGDAYEHGNMLVAKDLQDGGLVMEKSWLSAGDAKVRADHRANDAAGWTAIDAAFPSGHDRPPTDPRCRCATLYRRKPDA